MDKANDGVRSLNKRMGSALKQIRGGDKVCLDLICLVVVLAIGLYLYNMINSPSSRGGGGGGVLARPWEIGWGAGDDRMARFVCRMRDSSVADA